MTTFSIIMQLIGGLGVFLLGMKSMSEALQKVAGDKMRAILRSITGNRILGVLTGLLVTSIIQSSSATIVMLLSFVNAGLISLIQAIGVIMGANIGTTVTGWLVSLVGFQININAVALPVVGIGFFMRFFKRRSVAYWGEVLIGFGLLFLGLNFIKEAVPDMSSSPDMANWIASHAVTGLVPLLITILVGACATIALQSSSAAMAIVLVLAANGQIDFPTSAALILGENIGTTIKAVLISLGANVNTRRTAMTHMLFNVIGVVWAVILFRPLLALVNMMLPGDAFSTDIAIRSMAIPTHLAAFHTVFNIINTLLFLPSVHVLARIVTKMVPGKEEEPEVSRLKFIGTELVATPVLALTAARQELGRMVDVATDAFRTVVPLTLNPANAYGEDADKVQKLEQQTDVMDTEIVNFLSNVARNSTSARHAAEVTSLILMSSDIERIGDHCDSLLRLAKRRHDKQLQFSERAQEEIKAMADLVDTFLQKLHHGLTAPEVPPHFFNDARLLESKINEMRRRLRKDHVERLNNGQCQVMQGLVFLDMLTSFEKIGDHAINVAEGLVGRKAGELNEYADDDFRPAPATM